MHLKLARIIVRKRKQPPAMLGNGMVDLALDGSLSVPGHSVGTKTGGSANSHGGLASILNGLVVVVGSIGSGGSASNGLGCTDDLTRLGNVVRDWVGRWDAVVALGRGARSRQEQSDDDGGNELAVHHDDVAVRVVLVVLVVRGCCCCSSSVSVVLC